MRLAGVAFTSRPAYVNPASFATSRARAVTDTKIALLADRGVVSVTGEDADKLLQGLITNDIPLLASQPAIFAGLLSPQGKILFDFFVVKTDGGFLIETGREKTAELAKRLTMYKLRANVDIRDASEEYAVYALWGSDPHSQGDAGKTVSFMDPRLSKLGLRILSEQAFASVVSSATNGLETNASDYHAHRIALGVPEGGKDYAIGDTFPHEALFDQLHGVSFTKGCFVGQEVVSRMEHRTAVRKRVVPIMGTADLPAPGTEIKAGDVAIGTLGSTAGARGLALLRLDRAGEFAAKGIPLTAGGVGVVIELPGFATFAIPAPEATP